MISAARTEERFQQMPMESNLEQYLLAGVPLLPIRGTMMVLATPCITCIKNGCQIAAKN
ncbi:hypothetical protein SAMN04488244_112107 [Vibrio hangzhouensis]|uniref:Uncharacterized protein n=1 Tax=Vibrio hangzhouensis TaxID=462991 RepID=A0A1H5ZPM8_9VIBR|nr:hypothetical protein SAMN04488244_112107 [Vibrio hangzhouensis]